MLGEFGPEFAREWGRSQEGFLNGCCGRVLGQAAVSHALYITLGLFKTKQYKTK